VAAKKYVESSPRVKRTKWSEEDMRAYAQSPEAKTIGKRLRARGLDPSAKDLKEIPPFGGIDPALFRPLKCKVTTRIDVDVLNWLKQRPGKYQSALNDVLREAMQRENNQARKR
jgi:uncharacterized protein (DUF4415 family)